MSKKIADMLERSEHEVSRFISKLEDKYGYPSHDVRLLAQNIQTVRAKISDLGLDPDDTTGQELYHALLVKFEADSKAFDEANGVTSAGFDDKSAIATALINRHHTLPNQWALKTAAAKNVLRQHPPKHVMKRLRYRSVESMLKREDVAEIFLALPFMESKSWLKAHSAIISKLDPTCFESRAIRIVSLPQTKFGGLAGPDNNVALDNIIAAAGLWPSEETKDSQLISMILMITESLPGIELSELRLGEALQWWQGMDHVIANLNSEHISFNLGDVALSCAAKSDYTGRQLDLARKSFWNELRGRYATVGQLPQASDYSFEDILKSLRAPINQPAFEYEYAEDN